MESTICMNELCRGSTSFEWKKGWSLKSGGFAKLCYNCGSAYENVAFCELFHLKESGWRKCRICRKHIHCGCIASKCLYEFMNYGGVGCISCVSRLGNHASTSSIQTLHNDIPNGTLPMKNIGDLQPIGVENKVVSNNFPKGKLPQLSNAMETCEPLHVSQSQNDDENKDSLLHQGQNTCQIFPKQPKSSQKHGSISKGGIKTQTNIARPPSEGSGGQIQLLPRHRPKITDQELQQLSGDLKSNVVPLFDKVLTVSDVGRVGRLVLPKACAEAYFPPINQSEGLPVKIQDIMGKEYTFMFRFWLNNNSRMYVLEGVTSCLRSMQLQAGDTVTFSRIDPGRKLVMSFRKPTDKDDTQKKKRNIGSKRKRFLMHIEDAIEMSITMEEAQELLCPPPSLKPTIVTIEDIEFEEYHEPPVFGKGTKSGALSSGSCGSVPDEINHKEPGTSLNKGSKRQKNVAEKPDDCDPSGLEMGSASEPGFIDMNLSVNDCDQCDPMEVRSSNRQFDLNCQPSDEEDDDLQVEVSRTTTTHIHIANISFTSGA